MSQDVREVVVEILRHGPAHNQLVSPLTQYLALCGSHPAVSLSLPFEHRHLEHLLYRMSYPEGLTKEDERDRAFARDQLSQAVTELFEQIPALPHEGRVGQGEMLHLRLMTTPQELALLPFELANPPSGFESGGQPLLVGPTPDVVLTREVRRSSRVRARVPPKPKILFIAADPGGQQLPLKENRDFIANALRPWVRPTVQDGKFTANIDECLVVLEKASLDEIREHCANGDFTHIHILAHGAKLRSPNKAGFGLALWNSQKSGTDVIDGAELARALRPPQDDCSWSSPWSVVLCACDSGNQGGVVHPTPSLAHALHVAGIPFVVASQYPLTFDAANTLAETFYPLELRGEDPRRTLRDVRHAIASGQRHTHDWGSLVAYAGWHSDIDQELEEIRVVRAFAQIKAAQEWADRIIAQTSAGAGSGHFSRDLGVVEALVVDASDRLRREAADKEHRREDIKRREALGEISKHEKQHLKAKVTALLTEIYGLLGSASKRRARLLAHQGNKAEAKGAIREAAEWYLKGVELQAPEHWTPCQSFVLLALGWDKGEHPDPQELRTARKLWKIAEDNASRALEDPDPNERIWAYGTLIEVELWRPILGPKLGGAGKKKKKRRDHDATGKAKAHLSSLIAAAQPNRFPAQSTIRQLKRYLEWWEVEEYLDEGMPGRVRELLTVVPDELLATSGDEEVVREIDLPRSLARATKEEPSGQTLDEPSGPGPEGGQVGSAGGDEDVAGDTVFRVEMLPARPGDALWVEYGKKDDLHRILIDGGFRKTVHGIEDRIRSIASESPDGTCHFELGVVSHIDVDHIEGFIELLARADEVPVSFGDIWFNGRKHLDLDSPPEEDADDDGGLLGGKHGLFLDTALEKSEAPWNQAFDGGAIVVRPEAEDLPVIVLPGGMKLTIVSPTPAKLTALAKRWDDEVEDAGLKGANFAQVLAEMERLHYSTGGLLRAEKPSGPVNIEELLQVPDGADTSPPNGSSIAFVAEYDGRSCLFMADSHPDAMLASIDRLAGAAPARLRVGAVKVSHHGSNNNFTLSQLERLDSQVFLVSTNGARHYHPDRETIAKIVAGDWRPRPRDEYPIKLLFNYRNEYTKIWDDEKLMAKYNYTVAYADPGDILQLSQVPKTPA